MVLTAKDAAPYLAAMIDGEGCVRFNAEAHRRSVFISNTDPALIEACEQCCRLLGITYHVRWREPSHGKKKRYAHLTITGRANFETLLTLPIMAPAKRERLEAAVASYEHRYHRESSPPPWLETARAARRAGQTIAAIAETVGTSSSTLSRWLARPQLA
jgi:beta-phosphoglucomutase-like phosphatase (HAD superfamily)